VHVRVHVRVCVCCVVFCCAVLCRVVSCRVVSCRVMLCVCVYVLDMSLQFVVFCMTSVATTGKHNGDLSQNNVCGALTKSPPTHPHCQHDRP